VTSLHFTYLSWAQGGRTYGTGWHLNAAVVCSNSVAVGVLDLVALAVTALVLLVERTWWLEMQHRSQTGPTCLYDGAKFGRDPQVDLASWHIPLNEAHSNTSARKISIGKGSVEPEIDAKSTSITQRVHRESCWSNPDYKRTTVVALVVLPNAQSINFKAKTVYASNLTTGRKIRITTWQCAEFPSTCFWLCSRR
jgi:hypothetical protein